MNREFISLNPYFFGKCSTAKHSMLGLLPEQLVLILIFLENALRPWRGGTHNAHEYGLNPYFFGKCSTARQYVPCPSNSKSLNPYFFGKCSTAYLQSESRRQRRGLNPYFFGKCSTATTERNHFGLEPQVLILIFLENALRRNIIAIIIYHL